MATLYQQGLALQHVVGDISTLAIRDLTTLFDRYGETDVFDELVRRGVPELVKPYIHASGLVTARWYDQLAAGKHTDYRATAVTELPAERIDRTVEWALTAPGDASPLDRLAGSATRMVADASRQTVIENAKIERIRWARVASPGACAFCSMLATRGPVYHTEEDALASHDHCRCLAVPVRNVDDWQPPEYVQEWTDEYYEAKGAAEADGGGSFKDTLAQVRSTRAERRQNEAVAAWLDAEAEHLAATKYHQDADAELNKVVGGEAPAEAEAAGSELDRKLAEANAALEAGDYERADQLLQQADALERGEQPPAEKISAREAADRAKWDRTSELIDQGWAPDEAQAEAFGVPVERVRRDTFIAEARAEGHKGRGFDELLGEVHAQKAAEQYWEAEAATNGYMLKRKYDGKVDPRKLWSVNETTARKWMSDEMAAWFDENGRITRAGLRDAVHGGRGNWRNPLTEDFLQ